VPAPEGYESTRLLTRFGDLVYMFFMITPPEMTVERAWTRGLKVGRYKAVDDLLAHNVEAYSGIQRFHRWIHTDKRIKKDLILGVGSQIALVAVVVGLAMMAQYGVLDQALAK
jgi:hypothetical protein